MGVTKADVFHSCIAYNKLILKDRILPEWENTFPIKPYKHQIDGVQNFIDANGRLILGWEMGSGKTYGSTLIIHAVQSKTTIVFSPASLTRQWVVEIGRSLPKRNVYLIDSKTMTDQLTPVADDSILVVSYTIAKKFVDTYYTLGNPTPEMVVCDESHFIKNSKAQRSKAVKRMCSNVPLLLLLSGTPIINRPVDLFTQLQLCDPLTFENWFRFTRRFCGGKQGPFGWIADGLTREKELHDLLTNRMDRILKKDCLDLPSKTRTMVPLKIDNSSIDVVPDTLQTWQEAAMKLGKAKISHANLWIDDFVNASQDEKLIVFCKHREVAEEIQDAFNTHNFPPYALMFHGGTPMAKREGIINQFKRDQEARVLIMTIATGGTGLNLQFVSHVLFVETTFSPSEVLQAEDRIHRVGQKGTANIYYLTAAGTYDQRLFSLLTKKMSMTNKAIEGDFIDEENVFKELKKVTNAVTIGQVA